VRAALLSLTRDDSRLLIAGAAGLAALLTAIGFLLVPKGLVGNLISEAVGLAVGVVVALVLVERALGRQRAREWATVGDRTTRAIKRRIWSIGLATTSRGPTCLSTKRASSNTWRSTSPSR